MKTAIVAGFAAGFIVGTVLGLMYGKQTKSKIGESVTSTTKGGKLIITADFYKMVGLG